MEVKSMTVTNGLYVSLAEREGFNATVRHINKTLDLLEICNPKTNLADEVNKGIVNKTIQHEEVSSIIHMLLVEKWKYSCTTKNLASVLTNPSSLVSEVATWKAVDLVLAYHHPDLGFVVLNPKNPESISLLESFRKFELVIIYAGTQGKTSGPDKLTQLATESLIKLLEGQTVKNVSSLLTGSFAFVPPKKEKIVKQASAKNQGRASKTVKAQKPAVGIAVSSAVVQKEVAPLPQKSAVTIAAATPPALGQTRMSPLISVVVSNELFHNGNVEAWKRIIRSYNAKYPKLQVFIYYDGERIVDINTLFKWGKVKHGSCIQFRVSGDDIQDLAKLSRYFRQGASPQFEAFLRGSPDTVMNLF